MEALAYLVITALCVTLFAFLGAVAWLVGRLDWLRMQGRSPDLLPDYQSPSRYALLAWLWTGAHQALGDRSTTRAVLAARGFMIAFALAGAVLVELGQSTSWQAGARTQSAETPTPSPLPGGTIRSSADQ